MLYEELIVVSKDDERKVVLVEVEVEIVDIWSCLVMDWCLKVQ